MMVEQAVIEDLFGDFNYWREKTHYFVQKRAENQYMRALAPKPDRMKAIEEMAEWCTVNRIDPHRWLFFLFSLRRWRFAPRFNQLKSPKQIANYRRWRFPKLFRDRQSLKKDDGFDPNRDTDPTNEAQKAILVRDGKALACMQNMEERLGYHPKSGVCRSCPLRETCQRATTATFNFDIMALRSGKITQDAARHLAAYG